jgi:hypothetical protein
MTVAALRYFDVTGAQLFVIPIPNTTLQLFVAAGERESMVELLTSDAGGARRRAGLSATRPVKETV